MSARIPLGSPRIGVDLLSAYGASAARILSWMIVSALLYRQSREAFAVFAVLRATIGILNYTSLGVAPAVVYLLAQARKTAATVQSHIEVDRVCVNAWYATFACALLGSLATRIYATHATAWLGIRGEMAHLLPAIILCLGASSVIRLTSDTAGAVLQASNRIALDNAILLLGEIAWVGLSFTHQTLRGVVVAFLIAAIFVFIARTIASTLTAPLSRGSSRLFDRKLLSNLFAFGLLVTLAQAADYLYAPTDYVLIARLLSPIDVATYAPAVQIDGGLLVLVSALAAVLLPRSAIAFAQRDAGALRRYYLRGTVVSVAMLLVASLVVIAIAPWLFRHWLGDSLPATRAILPLVLLNTTLGGSGIVGRSVLLGMGKVRPFTIAVLIAGAVNVAASYSFVHYLHLGLPGIILGTVVAVIGRCVIWMPLYVLSALRQMRNPMHAPPA